MNFYFKKGLIEFLFAEIQTEPNSVTLVSDGAKCVLINKLFFIRNTTRRTEIQLRKMVNIF